MSGNPATPLLEECSPNGNVNAVVESDGRTVYFYLFGAPETQFGMRACWVRNLLPAPADLDRSAIAERGIPPMLPAASCAHPRGAPLLQRDSLSVVWFEEGDAAALIEDGQILAIIPARSGCNGFDGYARDCIAESPVCWPLGSPATNVLFDRVARAREYWRSWDDNPWPSFAERQVGAFERVLGNHDKYFAIDGGAWPPKALLRFDRPDAITFVTLGVSLRPMPKVERYAEDPSPIRRIELAMAIDPHAVDEPARRTLASYISGQSSLPWTRFTWFGDGHTLPCDSIPVGPSGNAFTAVLFVRQPPNAPAIHLPDYRNDPVSLLWLIPISAPEREFIIEHGAKEFLQRFAAAGNSWIHKDRPDVCG
jgi:hypothetical protein